MRAVLYMRMSTDKQENSIESQQNMLTLYAQNNKLDIVGKYTDEGISGRTAEKRPAFIRMIEDSSKNFFDAVLVYDSSRFARNLEESIVYKSILKKNNVLLISITEPSPDEDSALLTDAMLGALNEMYSRKLSKAVKRGMVYKAQQGKYQTPPPFGYTKKNGLMLVNKEEAKAVAKIFELFVQCPSWHSVAVKMNGLGIPKRKSYGWYSRDIKRILTNPAYIGYVYYDNQTYKGEHQPIIQMDIWEEAQKLINAKPIRASRPPQTYKHWLSGLLFCAYCGGRMNHVTDNKGNTSYRCGKYANGCCKYSNYISVPKLEQLTKKALETIIINADLSDYQYISPHNDKQLELEIVQAAIEKARTRLDRYKAAYSNGIDTIDEYKENKAACQKEEKQLLKQLEDLSANEESLDNGICVTPTAIRLADTLLSQQYSIQQKNMALRKVIDKIVINKLSGEFTVFYTMPST